ncbi:MAG TPA: nuclear transport factor 2 family protein [Acidimicrobiales bacterium]|nr:nuclear transport factor 2 family protein [Acidimicrobiales bacterium]
MVLSETEVELRSWMDRLAIQDLIHRYSDAVTRADWDQCRAVFAPDAVWESPGMGMRFDDPDAFLAVLTDSSTTELLIQTAHAPVINITGPDRARATTTIHEMMRGAVVADTTYGEKGADINFEQYGIYFDDIARIKGDWLFTHRLFVPIYVSPGSVAGDALTPRSGLLGPG